MWHLAVRQDVCSGRWRLWLYLSCSNSSKDPECYPLVCNESNKRAFAPGALRIHDLVVVRLCYTMGSFREDSRLDARWHASPSKSGPRRCLADRRVFDSQPMASYCLHGILGRLLGATFTIGFSFEAKDDRVV
jgi:hypothetical protein